MTNKNPAAPTEYTPGAKCSVCGLTVWSNGDTADAHRCRNCRIIWPF